VIDATIRKLIVPKCYRVRPATSIIMCRVTWVTVLVTIALAMSHVSQARADDKQEQARHEFSLGEDDDRAGKFEAAIGHYMRANDVLPHPFNLYNIAVDYERLGNLRQAGEWYERYLAAAPTSPDHDRVARTVADLKSHDSPLSVRTIPAGATVTIDGNAAGTTPLATKLPGGTHHVVVDLDGQHAEKAVELAYGEPGDVAFTLGGQAGTLAVSGAPAGAYVAVDDITIGIVPAKTQISAGTHSIRVSAAGYAPLERSVAVTANAETDVDAELVRTAPAVAPVPDTPSAVAFLVGVAGGGELHGGSYVGLGMIGTRILHYDLVFRIGRAASALDYDFAVRWQILDAPLTPFVAAGLSYENAGYGYVALVGVRWDVVRQPDMLVSLVLDGGLRDAPLPVTAIGPSQIVDPVELGAEVTFK
jgi:hypothetical protein